MLVCCWWCWWSEVWSWGWRGLELGLGSALCWLPVSIWLSRSDPDEMAFSVPCDGPGGGFRGHLSRMRGVCRVEGGVGVWPDIAANGVNRRRPPHYLGMCRCWPVCTYYICTYYVCRSCRQLLCESLTLGGFRQCTGQFPEARQLRSAPSLPQQRSGDMTSDIV